MHLSIIIVEMIVKERQKDFLAEAARRHMVRRARGNRPTEPSRWRDWLGNRFIQIGLKIKNAPGHEIQFNS